MNRPAKSAPAPASRSLLELENEMCKTPYLVEFIVTSLTRTLEVHEDEISLSYGEACALISLMEKVHQDIENAIGALADRKGGGADHG
jgi:hypothetical protein